MHIHLHFYIGYRGSSPEILQEVQRHVQATFFRPAGAASALRARPGPGRRRGPDGRHRHQRLSGGRRFRDRPGRRHGGGLYPGQLRQRRRRLRPLFPLRGGPGRRAEAGLLPLSHRPGHGERPGAGRLFCRAHPGPGLRLPSGPGLRGLPGSGPRPGHCGGRRLSGDLGERAGRHPYALCRRLCGLHPLYRRSEPLPPVGGPVGGRRP